GAVFAVNPSFQKLLQQVRETALAAYAHQDLPFEQLVDSLQPQRDLSYNPLTQVMLVLLNEPLNAFALTGLEAKPVDVESAATQYDLLLHLWDTPDGLAGTVNYSPVLFDASTIQRLIGHYQRLLEGVVAAPHQRVLDLPVLTGAETRQMLVDWNDTKKAFPHDKCLHELFELRVA